ncbi:MAG: metal ABC transporter permease [SAR202 cluster bacterium]|nr:metal ABC transporter permease [SAR202 cluster bacterium]
MIELLIDPFATGFAQRAALVCLLVALLAPVIGVWIIHRQLSYMADAMSHSTLVGVALAFAFFGRGAILPGALIAGLTVTLIIAFFTQRSTLPRDAVIAVVATGAFASGIIALGRVDTSISLNHLLFGQVLTVTSTDIWITVVLVAIVIAYVLRNFRDITFVTLDPMHARQVGIGVARQNSMILMLIAMSVVVCISTVGVVLTVSLLIGPALSARLITTTIAQQAAVGILLALIQVFTGFVVSYHLDLAPGPTIAILSTATFIVTYVLAALVRAEMRVVR